MEIFDWWSKYYSSQDPARKRQHLALNYLDTGRDTLKIYSNQLEDNFKDGYAVFIITKQLHGINDTKQRDNFSDMKCFSL